MRKKFNQRGNEKKNGCTKPRSKNGGRRPIDPKDASQERYDSKYADHSNDPKWYSVDPNLLRDSATYPYSWPIGTNISMDFNHAIDGEQWFTDPPKVVFPGVLTYWTMPWVGESRDSSSALNLASAQLYTYVRHVNSGHANYDPNDLMLYVTAMSSVYSYINFLQRLYGVLGLYAQRNRYLPKALVEAMGVNYDSISSSPADFRYRLNLMINKVSSFAVPASITYFARQAFMYAGIYSEGESIKDQLYLQCPAVLYRFALDTDGAGMLKGVETPMYAAVRFPGTASLATLDDLFDYAEDMIQPLLTSEDFGIMNGDVLKAYGREGIINLAAVNDNYIIVPEFNLPVLEQFKNANVLEDIVPVAAPNWSYDAIRQSANKGYLINVDTFSTSYASATPKQQYSARSRAIFGANHIITTHSAEGTPDITVENTRLKGYVKSIKESGTGQNLSYAVQIGGGSDIVLSIGVTTLQENGSVSTPIYGGIMVVDLGTTELTESRIKVMQNLKQFEFAPMTWVVMYNSTTSDPHLVPKLFQNVDNYAVITTQDLQRLHESCIMSLFHVQQIAKIS